MMRISRVLIAFTAAIAMFALAPAPSAAAKKDKGTTATAAKAEAKAAKAEAKAATKAEAKETSGTAASSADETVYATASGKKYHKHGCSALRGGGTAMKKSEAEAKGLTPCGKCNP